MKINWKVRFKKKSFWITIIPAVLLLTQQVAALFGYQIAIDGLQDSILAIVGTLFTVLVILGVVEDHTVKGLSDSKQALSYREPKDDNKFV